MATSLKDIVIHYRKKLDRNPDDDTLLRIVEKLSKITISVEILEISRIGKCIRQLSERDDIVGKKAKVLWTKWMNLVAESIKVQDASASSVHQNVAKEVKAFREHVKIEKKASGHHERETNLDAKYKYWNNSLIHFPGSHFLKKGARAFSFTQSSSSKQNCGKEKSQNPVDCDLETEIGKAYDPECPEFFSLDNTITQSKNKSPVDNCKFLSLKHKLKLDEQSQSAYEGLSKKLKRENHAISGAEADSKRKMSHKKKSKHNFYKDKTYLNSTDFVQQSSCNFKSKKEKSVVKCTNFDLPFVVKKSKHKEHKKQTTSKSSKTKPKLKIPSTEEFTSTNVSFEDCLGFNDFVCVSKKKISKSNSFAKGLSDTSAKHTNVSFQDCPGVNNIVSVPKKKVSKSNSFEKRASNKSNKHVKKERSRSTVQETKVTSSQVDKEKQRVSPSKQTDLISKIQSAKKDTSSLAYVDRKQSVSMPKPKQPELEGNTPVLPLSETQYINDAFPKFPNGCNSKRKDNLSGDVMKFTSSRKDKTFVYSGKKTHSRKIPTLFECCTRVLTEKVDCLGYLGGDVPYFLLKPMLERCTTSQLYTIEWYNPYLLEDTDELWKMHCNRDYKLLSPKKCETWRELYFRAHEEREEKLKSITASISASMSKSKPVRQVKLMSLNSFAGSPRYAAHKLKKNGTSFQINDSGKSGISEDHSLNKAQHVNETFPKNQGFCSSKQKENVINPVLCYKDNTSEHSGKKGYTARRVPTLFECCTLVLTDNVDYLGNLGGDVPYPLLKPVLERCTAFQLCTIEGYNPYLLEDTDELWEGHCKQDYNLLSPGIHKTWRERYLHALGEHEQRVESMTLNASPSFSKPNSEHQAEASFEDCIAKVFNNVAHKRAKNSTSLVNSTVKCDLLSKPNGSSSTPIDKSVVSNSFKSIESGLFLKSSNNAPSSASSTVSNKSSVARSGHLPKKPKIAPLMAKALKKMKQCYR